MPSPDCHFTERDLGAMIAYLKSVPPVDRELPPTRVGPMARALSYRGFPLLPAELIDHTAQRLAPPAVEDLLPGGANLTPVGLAAWTEADFFRAIPERKRPNGSTIDPAMPAIYAKMSDEELRAIWTYLKTVPRKGEKTKNQL